jgi:RimJ/RimL family protein N-acetyltransferase
VITSERLELRRMSVELLDALAAGDHARAQALAGFAIEDAWSLWDRAHARTRAAELRAVPERAPWISRAIVERASAVMVGRMGFHDRPGAADLESWCPRGDGPGAVEIGYAVFAPYRGRGYASEAAAALIDWATRRGIPQVVASVSPTNAASLRVIARLGFVRVGERMDERDGLEHVFVRDARVAAFAPVAPRP